MFRRLRFAAGLLVPLLASVAVSCAGATDSAPQGSSPPTTRGVLPIDFSQPGPYRVGILQINITPQSGGTPGTVGTAPTTTTPPASTDDTSGEPPTTAPPATASRNAAVYYPADSVAPGLVGAFTGYTTADAFPEATRAALPPEFVQTVNLDLLKEPPANREGPFPVVLNSHGVGSYYLFDSRHAQQLASWGFVVAAPDHQERSLPSLFVPPTGESSPLVADQDITDLRNTLQALRSQNLLPGGKLQGALNFDQVATEGLDAGARAAALMAADPVVKTFIGDAPIAPFPAELLQGDVDPAALLELTATKLQDVTPPAKPSMLIAASKDASVPAAAVGLEYAWLATPKTLAVLKNAGHNAFTDLCPPIRARGGLSQYSSRLPELATIFTKMEDGCLPTDLDPNRGYALINQLTIAQLRWVFGLDSTRASLDPTYLEKTFGDALERIDYQA